MNRRAVIAAPAFLAAAPASAICMMPLGETPIARMFREWKVAMEEERRLDELHPGMKHPDWCAARENAVAIEERIAEEPPLSATDMLIKVCVETYFGAVDFEAIGQRDFWADARAMIGGFQ